MMENTAPMGESPTSEETTDAVQVDHPAAQALLQAQSEYRSKTKGLLEGYYKAVDEIRDNTTKVDLPFPDVLTEQQKAEIILSQKAEEGEKLYQRTVTHYERAVEQFSQQAQKHTAKLRSDLFGVGEGGSAALSQAVGADEEQLVKMIELGELTGDPTPARAAFRAALPRLEPGDRRLVARLSAGAESGLVRDDQVEHNPHDPTANRRPAPQPSPGAGGLIGRGEGRANGPMSVQ